MRRRDFIRFFGGACLLLANAVPGNIGIARSESVVERLSVPQALEFNGESYRLHGVRTRGPTTTSRNISPRVKRASASSG